MGKVRRGRRVELRDRVDIVARIEKANKAGCRIQSACRAMGIDKRTFERWRKHREGDMRRGPISEPANKLTDEERQKILSIANSAEYRDKSPAQIVPLLADKGVYVASESSFYRVLKAAGLNAHRAKSKPASRKKPDELVATGPNQVYSWDITYLKSTVAGMFFYLYFFMDVYSRKIVGYAVHDEQSSELASDLIDSICLADGLDRKQLTLHSDNGGPMKGATMLATLQRLGVMPSFSRPSVSNDNPFSEALFKTMKYCPKYPSKPFPTKEDALKWVSEFVQWYNEEHLHSGIRFVTPASRHRGEDQAILAKRHAVYTAAQCRRPERWSGTTRDWNHIEEVLLNSLKGKLNSSKRIAA